MASCEMKPQDFTFLQTLPGNRECIDCGSAKPDWGSPKLGILFCFQCSGAHRGLGTHISFVRSVTLDSWTEKQIQQMKMGGNDQCKEFLSQRGINMTGSTSVKDKYDNPAAELYREVLLARVEHRQEPTELSARAKESYSSTAAPRVDPSRLQGFGSSPPPRPKQGPNKLAMAATATVVVGATVWIVVSAIL